MKKVKYNFIQDKPYYTVSEITDDLLSKCMNEKNTVKNNKGVQFFNVPCSFDIETTSFYCDIDGRVYDYEQSKEHTGKLEKRAIMYVFTFNLNGFIFIGRTWEEYDALLSHLRRFYGLSDKRRLIVYVHNLAFEFQFLSRRYDWQNVFCTDSRKPLHAVTDGIEYRCSYLLSGYSLEKTGEHLLKYKVNKLAGDLDYKLMRHSKTPLTEQEINYCLNDVKIVASYIQEQIEECGNITKIPLTKTGYVRKFCRAKCLRGPRGHNWNYINLMNELKINSLEEFYALNRAFTGGFTHANAEITDDILTDVSSYDFTSSYPYVMVSERFPMSQGKQFTPKNINQFEYAISKYHCIFDIEFTNIFATEIQDNPISSSRCIIKEHPVINNGRIVAAARIVTTITEIDYQVIKMFYSWESIKIGNMWIYGSAYLPTEFVDSILSLYEKKTKLKGVTGQETEYLQSKEMLNSCYGMTVTNPLRDEFTFNGVWDERELTEEEKLKQLQVYNESRQRFLFYAWGVYVTAYARRNLFTAIYELKNNYVYSDTDSVKFTDKPRYEKYFETYNAVVRQKLIRACNYHKFDFARCEPSTITGVKKLLGVWDFEGIYKRFKTLGAKRYITESEDGQISITVSGVNKQTAIPYLLETYGKNGVFDSFTNYLTIPPEATGKNIHTYIDYPVTGELTDYQGITASYNELSGLHLEPCGYSLSMSILYLNYLIGIKLKS